MEKQIEKLLDEADAVMDPYNGLGWDTSLDVNDANIEVLLAIEITTELTAMLMLNATGKDKKDLGFTADEIHEMIHGLRCISWTDDRAKKLLNEACTFIEVFMLTYGSVAKFEEL